ncbi:MAG: hypothetical protein H8E37_05190 [Planctomycetes bacterium]|nr:hypothetical protein [Planctomycetota bacterium]
MLRFSRVLLLVLSAVVALSSIGAAEEIRYSEDFALARDRAEALKQLIPGTEEYYYYHCLYYQHTEQFDKVDELLGVWIKRRKYTAGVHEILNRQALLQYDTKPEAALKRIRERMGLSFNHQRDLLGRKPNLPNQLDQNKISRATLSGRANSRSVNLSGYTDSALDWLVGTKLSDRRRRHLLQRLRRPDYEGLVELIAADLKMKDSPVFGSFPIHKLLLPSQLKKLLDLKSDLKNQTNFVYAWVANLHPASHIDWQNDRDEHEAYLDRLWKYVSTLGAVHNSLKASVLYRRLVFDRAGGELNKERFMTYVKLPRQTNYVNPKYLQLPEHVRYRANLGANYSQQILMPPIGNDEALVRSYLQEFLQDAADWTEYDAYLSDTWLKRVFAETKIVNGLGNAEQWSSLLSPAEFKALKERIDLDFAHTNAKLFGRDEPVSLDLSVKNVKKLIVRVFEINTPNYYRDHLRRIDTDISLDGLVANSEITKTYDEAPLRRAARHFEFPQLTKPGVYVIDFIGNGKSSRVLVRKGSLRHLVRTSTAGHIFTILNDRNEQIKDASLWLGGKEYKPNKDGLVTTPFSATPGSQPIVLKQGNFASLDQFRHESENYQLTAGIHVDRESLLSRQKARVVVRPSLTVNGTPVTLSVLEDVRLVITSTDHDGVSSSKEVSNFKLFEDLESSYEFQVPSRLQSLNFQLRASVKNLSQNKKVELATGKSVVLNDIERTEKTEDLYLANFAGKFVVELLGRTGEPLADRAVSLTLRHRDFTDTVTAQLQTDDQGRVRLGPLKDIVSVQARSPQGVVHSWPLPQDGHSYHQVVHAEAGKPVQMPFMGEADEPQRDEVSLLEVRSGTFIADRFRSLRLKNSLLQTQNLPAGEYDLWLKGVNRHVLLRVLPGKRHGSHVLGQTRMLEVRDDDPLQISSLTASDKSVEIQLQNASKFSRVHVISTRYQPVFSPFSSFGVIADPEPYVTSVPAIESYYVAGRVIGDELRYILDRKYAKRFPGNSLKRPSLLLNPWAVRTTSTGHQDAAKGGEFGSKAKNADSNSGRGTSKGNSGGQNRDFSNLDFLSRGSSVVLNLTPDEKGRISVPLEKLNGHHIHVVAIDPQQTVYRALALGERETQLRDLRLTRSLDLKKHFTQQKQVSLLAANDKFTLDDVLSSKLESYDSLASVFRLYATLSKNPQLVEFRFILAWPKLKPEEKLEKYSKYACHELNFFLSKKDPKFFDQIVRPYLANKQHKTFLDELLLGTDLTKFRKPWEYARLNSVERVLLARRLKGELKYTRQFIGEQLALLPPELDRHHYLYDTALGSSALDTGGKGDFGLDTLADDLVMEMPAGEAATVANAPAAPRPTLGPPATERPGGFSRTRTAGRESLAKLGDQPGEKNEGERRQLTAKLSELAAKQKRMKDLARKAPQANNGRADDYFESDKKLRNEARQLYQKLDKTQEWAENNYYHLPIGQQNADLVAVSAFWNDFAKHEDGKPFFSEHLAEPHRNFAEMMLALSVLDLPFEAAEHKSDFEGLTLKIAAGSPMILFHQEIREAELAENPTPILVSQNFFRRDDRYRTVDNERQDKFVTDEFLTHVVYGCQVVVTNPTSSRQKLNVLTQVPLGALPVLNTQYTKSIPVDLQPYHTQTIEYHFYFPATGDFPHYPVHVAKNEKLIASAAAVALHVVDEPTSIDKESWNFVSQQGSEEDVLNYLRTQNLFRVNLDRIAWRMKEARFFERVVSLLDQRHVYNHTLWSYSVQHGQAPTVRQYLQHAGNFVAQCGAFIDSPLLTIDPVERRTYEHLDYSPLVNARAHQLGQRRQILNDRLHEQYHRLLHILSYRKSLDSEDRMAITYYLLLQDRVEEAMQFFGEVKPQDLATRIQHDYFTAYLDLYSDQPDQARVIAAKYSDHPVPRWRNAFSAVAAQLDEIGMPVLAKVEDAAGQIASTDSKTALAALNLQNKDPKAAGAKPASGTEVIDSEDRSQNQTNLASTEPNLDFKVEARKVKLNYQNVETVTVNYYEMDIELLFSRNPFVQQVSGAFSYIRPNMTKLVKLPAKKTAFEFDLPKEYHSSNVLVEITGGGKTKSQAYYSHSLNVQVVENYGQVKVTHQESNKPLPRTYVKVYALDSAGQVKFYKDGYTDLRGRFDFTSLNTNELDNVRKFSLLILSDQHGAIVREAPPPKR